MWARPFSALLVLLGCQKPQLDSKAEADGLYLSAQTEYLRGNFDQALAHYERVKQLNPTDVRLPAAMGEVYLSQGKLDEALQAFEKAVKLDARRGTNFSRIGFIHALKGNHAAAAEALAKAIELNPKDFNALEQLGELSLKAGRLDEAVRRLESAAEAAPARSKPALYLRAAGILDKAGRSADAMALLERARSAVGDEPTVLTELGDHLVAARRLEEAVEAYTSAARLEAKDPTLWELVGELHLSLDRPSDAERAFQASLKVKDRGVVHVALARLCLRRNDERCARAELDEALKTASGEEIRESFDLADLLADMGRKQDALKLLRTVSAEPDQLANAQLHLKVAKWAKELGDQTALDEACARARAADAGVRRCP